MSRHLLQDLCVDVWDGNGLVCGLQIIKDGAQCGGLLGHLRRMRGDVDVKADNITVAVHTFTWNNNQSINPSL